MILTIKQKMLLDSIKKLYPKIHKKTTVLSEDYCNSIIKQTIDEIYKVNPDRKSGKISINWFDSKMNKTQKIDDTTDCFEINFYDVYTGMPWLICRFYKCKAKVGIYCCN